MEFLTPGALTSICDGPDCDFADFVTLIKLLINTLIVLSTFLATAVFAYSGFKLLTSQGNEGAMSDAKAMIGKVIKGYVVILSAWLIVYTITNTLLKPGYSWLQ